MINERTGADGKTYGIGFSLALPDNWNNRFLFQGGGGYNGSVRPPLGGCGRRGQPWIGARICRRLHGYGPQRRHIRQKL